MTTVETKAPTMRRALRHTTFRRLIAALAISQIGDWLYNVALLAVVYERTHSAAWVAATTAARVLPVVVFGPFGGVIADRFDRRRVMIVSSAVQALTMAGLALSAATTAAPVALLPVLAALTTLAGCPYPPCVAATTPQLVPDEDLVAANAVRSGVNAASIVVGPAIGGVLLMSSDPAIAFLLNAATFVISGFIVAALGDRDAFRPSRSAAVRGWFGNLVDDLRVGATALRGSGDALRLVGADIMCSILYGAQTVLFIVLARSLGWGSSGYGWLLAGCGAGGVLGTAIATRVAQRVPARIAVAAALLMAGAPTALMTLGPSRPVAVLLAVISGAGAIAVEVLADTWLQRCVDEQTLGRAYGFAFPAAIGGIVIGALGAGPLEGVLGLSGTLLAVGLLVLGYGAVLVGAPIGRRRPAPAPAPADQPARVVDLVGV